MRLPLLVVAALTAGTPLMAQDVTRPRARDAGVVVGVFDTGALNAITDVAGVRVGQTTVTDGGANTGITAILPHGGNLFRDRVPAAIVVANGFGKLIGITQVRELGELETPIVLTCTLCVWRAADAMVGWLIAQPGMEEVRSINPVVGETNDGALNDIRARPITPEHVVSALEGASTGMVEEGSVGAGAGTVAFGWKGGIGTSSRVLPAEYGGHSVGVLVQTNYGGILTINGAPVGRELGRYSFQRATGDDAAERAAAFASRAAESGHVRDAADAARANGRADAPRNAARDDAEPSPDGSIMIVVATDAPLDARNLERLATRALVGLARTGSSMSNGSGDYVIAFSTAESVRRAGGRDARTVADTPNDALTPLFQAVAEATEEAIYNSMFRATTVAGTRTTIEALPLERTLEILRRYGAIRP